MKSITLKCCLIIVFIPNLISADCSFFEPLENFDRIKSGKAWYSAENMYTNRRYANGAESNSICQKYNIRTPASETKTLYYADGSTSTDTFSLLPAKSGCNNGRIEMNVTAGIPSVYFITYTDYKQLWVIRACFNDEGSICLFFFLLEYFTVYIDIKLIVDFLWIVSSALHPCKKLEELIDKVIKEQHLDRKPIFKLLVYFLRFFFIFNKI